MSMRRVDGMLAIAVFVAAPAFASEVSNEVSAARSQQTDANPRAGSFADILNASFDLGEKWSLNAGAMLTVESGTSQSGSFAKSNTPVTLFSLGIDYEVSDHWTAGLGLEWSPKSTLYSA